MKIYDKWTRVRQAAARSADASSGSGDVADGQAGPLSGELSLADLERLNAKFDAAMPQIGSSTGSAGNYGSARSFLEGLLPPDAELSPNAGAGYRSAASNRRGDAASTMPNGSSNGLLTSTAMPYLPEFSSPDRQSFPIHRVLANRYWRMFYKLDPVIGTCIDLMSELPWGNFELSGEGVEGEVRDMMEHMSEVCQIRTLLPFFTREYFVVGEAIPHAFFDDDKGIWTYVTLHNPDQVEVVHAPFMNMDPYLEFVPDDKLRQVLTQDNAIVRHLRESMPPDLLARLLARENIALSPVNCTFLPRKQHFYDTRGTSIVARMWRTLMYEDALYSASLATARRMACFVAGTSVLTVDGAKNIEDVKIGERVIAGDGSTQTVENAWCAGPSSDGLTEIKALGTQPLLCTPNHKFLAWVAPRTCACGCGTAIEAVYDKTGSAKRRSFVSGHHLNILRNKKNGQMTKGATIAWRICSTEPKLRVPIEYEPLQKIEARDLRIGDYLLIPRRFDEMSTATKPEAARLLGYFAAEGSEKNTQNYVDGPMYEGVAFTLSLAEGSTWAKDIEKCAAELGVDASIHVYVPGADTKMAQSGREGRTNVTIRRKKDIDFVRWLKRHARVGANNHVFSEEVMRWPIELKRELVRGYFRGDGHLGFPSQDSPTCPQVLAASTSKSLIYQLRVILAQLGVFGSISYNPKGDKPGEENWNDCWIISSTGRDARTLALLIWGVEIEAPPREGSDVSSGSRTWCDDRYVYVPVQSVKQHDDELLVYNLTVSGDESYLSEGVYSRNSPLKIAKLGNPATNWIPGPEHERRLLELIAQAETDPGAWLAYHFAVQFELVGVQERVMKIDASAELIERNKLIALGVSKSFLHGEVSYASSKTGLTIFLRRLKAIRDMFESSWLYPKFFRQAAEINKWVKPTPAELSHRVRVRRSHKELLEDHRYIVPRIEWDHSLNPAVDAEMINAMQGLSSLGIKFSKTTSMAAVGRNFEEELNMLVKDSEAEQRILKDHPELLQPQGGGDAGGGGMIGGGGPPPVMPAVPPDTFSGFSDAGPGGAPPPDAGPGAGDMAPPMTPEPAHAAGVGAAADAAAAPDGSLANNAASRLMKDFLSVVSGYQPDEELWERALQSPEVSAAMDSGDVPTAWDAAQQWLAEQDYPAQDIVAMGALLQKKARVKVAAADRESDDPALFVGAGFLPRR